MSPPPLIDPEVPSLPPCPCRCPCWCPCRCRSGCRRFLPVLAAAGAAAALGAAAAAAAVVILGVLRGEPPQQVATAAHLLLSAGSLTAPPGPSWRYEEGISGVFLSSDLQLTATRELKVTTGGLYLLYGHLALSCISSKCPRGRVRLQLRRQGSPRPLLEVPLELLPGEGSDPIRSGLVQAVGKLQAEDVLSLQMSSGAGELLGDSWQLAQGEREENFMGLLRIAAG